MKVKYVTPGTSEDWVMKMWPIWKNIKTENLIRIHRVSKRVYWIRYCIFLCAPPGRRCIFHCRCLNGQCCLSSLREKREWRSFCCAEMLLEYKKIYFYLWSSSVGRKLWLPRQSSPLCSSFSGVAAVAWSKRYRLNYTSDFNNITANQVQCGKRY